MWQEMITQGGLVPLLAALASTAAGLHILFRALHLRRRLAPKMRWWTPTVVLLAFVGGGLLLVRLTEPAARTASLLIPAHIGQGIYLGVWLACVPLISPNKRWDKS